MTSIPNWLKHDPFVAYLPTRTVFAPQRKLTHHNSAPHLLDANGDRYPLADCCQLRWEQLLQGVWVAVTDAGAVLSLYSQEMPSLGGRILVVSSGSSRKGVRLSDEVENAAQAFLNAFPGSALINEDAPL